MRVCVCACVCVRKIRFDNFCEIIRVVCQPHHTSVKTQHSCGVVGKVVLQLGVDVVVVGIILTNQHLAEHRSSSFIFLELWWQRVRVFA